MLRDKWIIKGVTFHYMTFFGLGGLSTTIFPEKNAIQPSKNQRKSLEDISTCAT
jgi:hypothetical protein